MAFGGFCHDEHFFQSVDFVFNVVAELEGRYQALFDENGFAGSWVAGRAGLAGLAGKSAKTADLDGVAIYQLLAD